MEFAFTWVSTIALDLCCLLGDPNLVIWFMSFYRTIYLKIQEKFSSIFETTSTNAGGFHVHFASKKRFSEMNSSVPIAFPLPFDGDRWRKYTKLINSIHYFRENFIQTVINYNNNSSAPLGEGFMQYYQLLVSDVIKIVNLILDDKYCGTVFEMNVQRVI